MKACLIDQRTGEVFEITKQRIIIGRTGAGVDITVKDPAVSRCHCSLYWENDGWYAVDMDTTNHTYINNVQLKPKEKYPLRYGDELAIAQAVYRLEQRSASGEYDIFISYKNSDRNGGLTRDSQMAEELYQALKKKGFNPFFSKYSIDESTRSDYVDVIDRALESAKILVAVGTSKENLSSKWVRSEINQFRTLMNEENNLTRSVITYRSTDFSPNHLPSGIRQYQSYDDPKAVVRFIELCLKDASGFRSEGGKTELTYEDVTTPDIPSNQAHTSLQIGDKLYDRFQILHLVGEGGMSRVYLAYDMRMGKTFAVKEYVKGKSNVAAEAMRLEIELLKTLNHPAIPKIYDIVENDDSLIIVMEYVEGRSIDRILSERTSFPEEKVLEFARQLGELLDYLHDRPAPIIYRDMKPGNLMLQPDGTLKLIDFGTARIYEKNASSDTVCLGTRGYAAPEQYGGMGQTDPRTDIYGLGITLHQMVTGKDPTLPPYEILSIRQINPKLSKKLEAIIEKCTQRDPDKRYQSAKELLRAIERASKPGMWEMMHSYFKAESVVRKRKPTADKPIPRSKTVDTDVKPSATVMLSASEPQENVAIGHPRKVKQEILPDPSGVEKNLIRKGAVYTGTRTHPPADMEEVVNRFLSLDTESQLLIRELIIRLSK